MLPIKHDQLAEYIEIAAARYSHRTAVLANPQMGLAALAAVDEKIERQIDALAVYGPTGLLAALVQMRAEKTAERSVDKWCFVVCAVAARSNLLSELDADIEQMHADAPQACLEGFSFLHRRENRSSLKKWIEEKSSVRAQLALRVVGKTQILSLAYLCKQAIGGPFHADAVIASAQCGLQEASSRQLSELAKAPVSESDAIQTLRTFGDVELLINALSARMTRQPDDYETLGLLAQFSPKVLDQYDGPRRSQVLTSPSVLHALAIWGLPPCVRYFEEALAAQQPALTATVAQCLSFMTGQLPEDFEMLASGTAGILALLGSSERLLAAKGKRVRAGKAFDINHADLAYAESVSAPMRQSCYDEFACMVMRAPFPLSASDWGIRQQQAIGMIQSQKQLELTSHAG